jgi:type II secretory pathway component GspD/PulD (secretin)
MNAKQIIFGAALFLSLCAPLAHAQTEAPATKPGPTSTQMFFLVSSGQPQEANEVLTALRNVLNPPTKITLVATRNAILVEGPPDQLALAQKLIGELDHPRKTYRLTYTLTEVEGGKRMGVQHYSMIVYPGQRTVLKQGNRVPIITGNYKPDNSTQENQVTYVDIGLNFVATLDELANGGRLNTKVEESSVAEERSGVGPQDPIIRQSSVEGTSILTLGKPLIIGSLDIAGSTRRLDIDVMMEAVQ